MEKIIADYEQLDQNKLVDNGKIWKRPVLIQLNVKQTLSRDCGSGLHWDDNANSGAGGCVPG